MGNFVAQFRENNERKCSNKNPLNDTKQALASRVNIASSSIEVRHELTVGTCSQVPGQIHCYQEDDGLYVNGIL